MQMAMQKEAHADRGQFAKGLRSARRGGTADIKRMGTQRMVACYDAQPPVQRVLQKLGDGIDPGMRRISQRPIAETRPKSRIKPNDDQIGGFQTLRGVGKIAGEARERFGENARQRYIVIAWNDEFLTRKTRKNGRSCLKFTVATPTREITGDDHELRICRVNAGDQGFNLAAVAGWTMQIG